MNETWFFKGHRDMLSNMHRCLVNYDDYTFTSAEQAYQHTKAIYCHRPDLAHRIFHCQCPYQIKALGKLVKTNRIWYQNRVRILRLIVRAKLQQNPAIAQTLRSIPPGAPIAECVPGSYFWACGLDKATARRTPPAQWPGRNMMAAIYRQVLREM